MSEQPQEERTTDRAERLLIERIIDGTYPPNTDLPGERPLSKEWDIARPALREAMQRLSRDGWLDIQQGKPTRVKDYLHDGNLNILAGLLKADPDLIPELVPNLLEMWLLLAPSYTAASVRRAPGLILDLLEGFKRLPDEAEPYALGMWELHYMLINYCGNLVYGLIFNTFKDFYHQLATFYYGKADNRALARDLWMQLSESIEALDTEAAAQQIYEFTAKTHDFWKEGVFEQYKREMLTDATADTDQQAAEDDRAEQPDE